MKLHLVEQDGQNYWCVTEYQREHSCILLECPHASEAVLETHISYYLYGMLLVRQRKEGVVQQRLQKTNEVLTSKKKKELQSNTSRKSTKEQILAICQEFQSRKDAYVSKAVCRCGECDLNPSASTSASSDKSVDGDSDMEI